VGGVGDAFGVGAAISAVGIVLAVFLRKPSVNAPASAAAAEFSV
jgi:hypothetical protein